MTRDREWELQQPYWQKQKPDAIVIRLESFVPSQSHYHYLILAKGKEISVVINYLESKVIFSRFTFNRIWISFVIKNPHSK